MSVGRRAVIYCRVSTSSDSQMESLDKQIAEAIQAVEQLGYELVERFIDEGKTGTVKEARKEYLRMLSQIEENKFDVIVTKSLDRMNRNILDFYLFLDLIMKNDVRLYFYLDRNFYKSDDKIVIGIKAILAEEYSRELSKKLCNAHARRQERGEVIMLSSQTYGYRKVTQPDGKRTVMIEDKEAEMIRLIFDYCREGYGARAISGILLERGYVNRKGNPITESTIRRIIRNPLVTGTMIMNKTKFDFNSKTLIMLPSSQWIHKEGAVPPIITAKVWREANARMDERVKKGAEGGKSGGKGVYAGSSHFSGKIACGLCERPYYKITKMRAGKRRTWWGCSTYVKLGKAKGCPGLTLDETELIEIMGDVAREHFGAFQDKQAMIGEIISALDGVLQDSGDVEKANLLKKKLQSITGRRQLLLKKYLDGRVKDELYVQMDGNLQGEVDETKKELQLFDTDFPESRDREKRLGQIENFLGREGVEKALAYAFLDVIKKIVVYEDYLEIQLNTSCFSEESGENPGGAEGFSIKASLETHRGVGVFSYAGAKKKICRLIAENPEITIEEIAKNLRIGKRTVSERMAELRAEGILETQGHGLGTVRYVKILEPKQSNSDE